MRQLKIYRDIYRNKDRCRKCPAARICHPRTPEDTTNRQHHRKDSIKCQANSINLNQDPAECHIIHLVVWPHRPSRSVSTRTVCRTRYK